MSWQSDITQAIANLTNRLNQITTSARKIFELPWQILLNPASKIHVSNPDNESEFITVQQILDAALSYRQNQLVEANVTVDGNDITVDAGAKWIINNINHELATDFTETITHAETGYTRNDILVGNEANIIYRVIGPETEGVSPTPNVPLNTVLITTINVTDSTIGYVPPVIGEDFEVKINKTDDIESNKTSSDKYASAKGVADYVDNKTATLLKEEFTWTSGVQEFTLANNYYQVYSVEVQGQGGLHSSQYQLISPNKVKVLDELDVNDYVIVLYSTIPVGVSVSYTSDPNAINTGSTPQTKTGGLTVGNTALRKINDNWIALGTSVTARGLYTIPMSRQLNVILTNLGVEGADSGDISSHYSSIPTLNSGNQDLYRIISLEYSLNDALRLVPLSTFRTNIENAIAHIKGKNWSNDKILLINGNYSTDPLRSTQESYANEVISIAKEQGVQYSDIYNYTKNNGGGSLTSDGVHITSDGGLVYVRGVIASMKGGGEFTNSLTVNNAIAAGGFISYEDIILYALKKIICYNAVSGNNSFELLNSGGHTIFHNGQSAGVFEFLVSNGVANGSVFAARIHNNGGFSIGTSDLNENKFRVDEGSSELNQLKYTRAIDITSTDLNTLNNAGFYSGNGLSNKPLSTNDYYYITVERFSESNIWVHQTATVLSGSSSNRVFTRILDAGTWSGWREVVTSDMNGKIPLRSYTVSSLPSGTEGDTAYVTDATAPTYLGVLTGGGTIKCPVFYNGTSWVSH